MKFGSQTNIFLDSSDARVVWAQLLLQDLERVVVVLECLSVLAESVVDDGEVLKCVCNGDMDIAEVLLL